MADSGSASISILSVQAPIGAKVTVYCTGPSCKWRKRWQYTRTRTVRLRAFEHRLRADTTLSIYVTKAGFTGKYTRFRFNKRRPPSRRDLCALTVGGPSVSCAVN
jgi:hypothetical protein